MSSDPLLSRCGAAVVAFHDEHLLWPVLEQVCHPLDWRRPQQPSLRKFGLSLSCSKAYHFVFVCRCVCVCVCVCVSPFCFLLCIHAVQTLYDYLPLRNVLWTLPTVSSVTVPDPRDTGVAHPFSPPVLFVFLGRVVVARAPPQ